MEGWRREGRTFQATRTAGAKASINTWSKKACCTGGDNNNIQNGQGKEQSRRHEGRRGWTWSGRGMSALLRSFQILPFHNRSWRHFDKGKCMISFVYLKITLKIHERGMSQKSARPVRRQLQNQFKMRPDDNNGLGSTGEKKGFRNIYDVEWIGFGNWRKNIKTPRFLTLATKWIQVVGF